MIEFHPDPPIPLKKIDHAFSQTLHMRDGDHQVGRVSWAAGYPSEGVVQILELWIDPDIRRSGHGRRLFQAMLQQARAFQQLRRQNLRRVWVGVGHKTQVVGRSFLTSEGFHHIGSTCGLLEDQDMLIYVKSLD